MSLHCHGFGLTLTSLLKIVSWRVDVCPPPELVFQHTPAVRLTINYHLEEVHGSLAQEFVGLHHQNRMAILEREKLLPASGAAAT